jgi:hypothetical protein
MKWVLTNEEMRGFYPEGLPPSMIISQETLEQLVLCCMQKKPYTGDYIIDSYESLSCNGDKIKIKLTESKK